MPRGPALAAIGRPLVRLWLATDVPPLVVVAARLCPGVLMDSSTDDRRRPARLRLGTPWQPVPEQPVRDYLKLPRAEQPIRLAADLAFTVVSSWCMRVKHAQLGLGPGPPVGRRHSGNGDPDRWHALQDAESDLPTKLHCTGPSPLVERLGLELIEVRRLPPRAAEVPHGAGVRRRRRCWCGRTR
jgi:hypothetical protein